MGQPAPVGKWSRWQGRVLLLLAASMVCHLLPQKLTDQLLLCCGRGSDSSVSS